MPRTVSQKLSDFDTAIEAAITAVQSRDWDEAFAKLAEADLTNAALDLEAAAGESRVRRRESLNSIRQTLESAANRSAGSSDRRRFIRTSTGYPS